MIQIKGPHLILRLTERQKRWRRYSWMIGVPRKVVPLATRRNRWKRRIREVLRRVEVTNSPYQINIIVHNISGSPDYRDIWNEITKLIAESGVMK